MPTNRLLDDIAARLSQLAAGSPAGEIEKNTKALLSSAFSRMDLVTREEFDLQRDLLAKAREKMAALEAKVAELETKAATRK